MKLFSKTIKKHKKGKIVPKCQQDGREKRGGGGRGSEFQEFQSSCRDDEFDMIIKRSKRRQTWLVIFGMIGVGAVFIIALIMSIFLFIAFYILERKFYTEKIDMVQKNVKMRIENDMTMKSGIVKSLKAFYFGSSFVDGEEFEEFVDIADLLSEEDSLSCEWIDIVPKEHEEVYRTKIYSKFKLSVEEETKLNQTSIENEYEFITSYVQPRNIDNVGIIAEDRLEVVYSSMLTKNVTTLIQYSSNQEEITLELYLVVNKSHISQSISSMQNGIIKGVFDYKNSFDEIFTSFQDIEYAFYYNSVALFSSIETYSSENVFQRNFNLQMSGEDDATFVFFPKSSFFDSYYKVLKWIGLFSPMLFCIFWFVIVVFIVYRRSVHYKSIHSMKLFELISEGITELDLEGKCIQQLEKKPPQKCSKIENILKQIISNMKTYIPFLPQTLIEQKNEIKEVMSSCCSEATEECKFESFHSENLKTPSSKKGLETPAKNSPLFSSPSSSIKTPSPSKQTPGKKGVSSSAIKQLKEYSIRTVVLLTIAVVNVNKIYEELNSIGFNKLLNDYLSMIYSCVAVRYRGDYHYSKGFTVLFSFNAIRKNLTAELNACSSAFDIVNDRFFRERGLQIVISITSSKCYFGNFEFCSSIQRKRYVKAFDIFGAGMFYRTKLLEMNLLYNTQILVDDKIKDALPFRCEFKALDYIKFGNYKPMIIYELVNHKTVNSDEWMYELKDHLASKQSEDTQNYSLLEECWRLFISGSMKNIEQAKKSRNPDLFQFLDKRMEDYKRINGSTVFMKISLDII